MDFSELEKISEKDMMLALGLIEETSYEIEEFKYEITGNDFIKIINYISNNIQIVRIN